MGSQTWCPSSRGSGVARKLWGRDRFLISRTLHGEAPHPGTNLSLTLPIVFPGSFFLLSIYALTFICVYNIFISIMCLYPLLLLNTQLSLLCQDVPLLLLFEALPATILMSFKKYCQGSSKLLIIKTAGSGKL